MNKIYSLRYSVVAEGFIAVSEFVRKCSCRISGRTHLKTALLLSPLLFSCPAGASIVSADIDYQIFRDFAENKGIFSPGATDIAIYNKQGQLVGTLDKAGMPDFSAVNVKSYPGVATLINPQYIASVKHNKGYKNVSFGDGDNRYNIVDRNEHGTQDFHAPRLDKLVTEVAPAAVTEEGQKTNAYANTERYTAFYRLGSGTQYIKDEKGNITNISGGYSYLTGGTVGAPSSSGNIVASSPGNVFNPVNGPLSSYGASGDSGSPLFAYDSWQKKWVMVGVLSTWTGVNGVNSRWAVIPLDFLEQKFDEDSDAPVTFSTSHGGNLEWTFDSNTGTGALTQGSATYTMHGQKGNDLNAGKNLEFLGQNGLIDLKNNILQGAGSLTFRNDYTVATSNGSTWTGAGIIVDKEATVNWQVNGVKGDNLHKIGEGTLVVQGTGVNEGGLKVGDGTVVLNQQADDKGLVQAFSSVNIASGRPTVVLTDDRQVDPDNISWGYRGGTLDVNGNSLTFHQLKAADYGAVLANNAADRATITLDYSLKATAGYLFHGQLKGNLNVENRLPEGTSGALVLDGSADISGSFTQENGRLTLQGHPVIHAYNALSVADKLASTGDSSVLTQPTSFDQEDWENRAFTFDRLSLNSTDFSLGRNATLNTTLEATDSTITLGDSRVFIDKKDGDGTTFVLEEGTSEAVRDVDRSVFNGSAVLTGDTNLNIMNATFNGDITGRAGSHVELSSRSHWNMTKSSSLNSFSSQGGTLSLITDDWSPKTLTVNTMDASSMHIAMGVSTADNVGDRIDILDQAMGGDNTLDLSCLFDQTVTLTNDLILASAPGGTSHGYFSFASLNRGFTVYTPDTEIQEKDGKVFWQLKGNASSMEPDVSPDPDNNTSSGGSPSVTPGNGDIDQDSAVTGGGNNNVTVPDNSLPSGGNPGTTVNGSTLFKGEDNTPLLKKTRAMFAAREFILSDSADRWQQVVDNSGAEDGILAITGYSHGGYDDFTLNQSGLNVGFRQPVVGNAWWGIGTELYRGYSRANGYRDDFSLWGMHILAGKSFAGGMFVDGMAGYRNLYEDYTIQGELNDLSGKVKSHILTTGIRTGWKTYLRSMDITVIPTISLNSARMDGNRLQGKGRSVELHSGNAAWLKAGAESEKILGRLTLKTGIWRHITLNDMPGMSLSDDWKTRHYGAEKGDRYTASFGINGKLSEKLSVQAKVSSSFDGYFKTDAEGVFSVRYDF